MTAPLHAPYNSAVFDAWTIAMAERSDPHPNLAPAERRAEGAFPIAAPSAGRPNVASRQRFTSGDRVKVRSDCVPGHIRMPGYIRGKTGIVVSESPE